VRLVAVAALVLLTVCLAAAFVHSGRSMFVAGIVLLVTSFVWGAIGAIVGEILSHRRRVAGQES
jgi:hypothetical protein